MNIDFSKALVPVQIPHRPIGPVAVLRQEGANHHPFEQRPPASGGLKFIGYGFKEKDKLYGPSGRADGKNGNNGVIVDLYV